jgi:hypothetical protein
MAARRTLELKTKQRQELAEYRDHAPRPYMRERGGALLKIAGGETAPAVARRGLRQPRDPDTRYGWLRLYEAAGVSGLVAHQPGWS